MFNDLHQNGFCYSFLHLWKPFLTKGLWTLHNGVATDRQYRVWPVGATVCEQRQVVLCVPPRGGPWVVRATSVLRRAEIHSAPC